MPCVYTPEDISFPCIMEIIQQIRAGEWNTQLVRKVIKQLDSALSKFSPEEDSISFSNGQGRDSRIDYLCKELETIDANHREQAETNVLSIGTGIRIALLLKALLWELLA